MHIPDISLKYPCDKTQLELVINVSLLIFRSFVMPDIFRPPHFSPGDPSTLKSMFCWINNSSIHWTSHTMLVCAWQWTMILSQKAPTSSASQQTDSTLLHTMWDILKVWLAICIQNLGCNTYNALLVQCIFRMFSTLWESLWVVINLVFYKHQELMKLVHLTDKGDSYARES